MEINKNEYSNHEITVTYEPCLCIQSGKCAKELSDVFSMSVIPWINLDHADNSEIVINQIKKCPSGALNYRLNSNKKAS